VSAMLVIIVVEILANTIRNNPRLKGIKIGDVECKIGQSVNDTTLFLGDEQSLMLALPIIDMLSKCSGFKMNRDKSEFMYIGISSNFRHKTSNIRWSNEYVKYLGVYVDKDNKKASTHSITLKLEKIQNLIKIWSNTKRQNYHS
jgi:hypothetical protein